MLLSLLLNAARAATNAANAANKQLMPLTLPLQEQLKLLTMQLINLIMLLRS